MKLNLWFKTNKLKKGHSYDILFLTPGIPFTKVFSYLGWYYCCYFALLFGSVSYLTSICFVIYSYTTFFKTIYFMYRCILFHVYSILVRTPGMFIVTRSKMWGLNIKVLGLSLVEPAVSDGTEHCFFSLLCGQSWRVSFGKSLCVIYRFFYVLHVLFYSPIYNTLFTILFLF